MRNVDVVIISWAKNDELKNVTKNGLDTLFNSASGDVSFHAYVVESNPDVNYDEYNQNKWMHSCRTIHPEDKTFGYHKYLNIGVGEGSSEYVVLCNSDLTYEKDWASHIINEMEKDPYILSASPWCPQTQGSNSNVKDMVFKGYRIRAELAGWCIFQQRVIYDLIGKLDEDITFWYSDNIYADELEARKIKHCLVCSSVVNHHDGNIGKTGESLDGETMLKYTNEEQKIYLEKKKKLEKNSLYNFKANGNT